MDSRSRLALIGFLLFLAGGASTLAQGYILAYLWIGVVGFGILFVGYEPRR